MIGCMSLLCGLVRFCFRRAAGDLSRNIEAIAAGNVSSAAGDSEKDATARRSVQVWSDGIDGLHFCSWSYPFSQ